MASVVVDLPRQSRRHNHRYEDDFDSHEYDNSMTTIAAPYTSPRDYEYRESSMRGALVRPTVPHVHSPTVASTVIEEPVIEHEHHHLHHHIDHGDVSGRVAMSRVNAGVHSHPSRPSLGREYSYDDLDLRERRYANGTTVSTIHRTHEHPGSPVGHRRRHRHRHRGRHGESIERTRFSRSDIDLTVTATSDRYDSPMFENDDVTVVDVPPGTKRVYVNVDKNTSGHHRERDSIDWRREHGVRRSRGLGNELWTEITKDLVTREAIEDCGYPFEETEYFYYIFEYLDRDQIAELRELTEDIRHERVRDIEYQSIAGSTPRVLPSSRSDYDDSRTEIVIESSGSQRGGSNRRRYYY